MEQNLGPPVVPFYLFLGEGSPAKINYRNKASGTLILSSLLEDLGIRDPLFEEPGFWTTCAGCKAALTAAAPCEGFAPRRISGPALSNRFGACHVQVHCHL